LNPQANGSLGSFFVWDGNTAEYLDGDDAHVFGKSDQLLISGNSTDIGSEILRPAQAASATQAYRFVAKASELTGGVNTWRAYDNTIATGPTGGLIYDNYTVGDKIYANNGGIDSVFTEGGEWLVGVAFTTNNGVTPLASIYRTIVVDAAADTFTIKPVEFAGLPPVEPVEEADLTAGLQSAGLVSETADSKTLAIAAGQSLAGQTLSFGSFPAGLTGSVTLDALGNGTIDASSVPTNRATKLYLAQSDNTVVAWDSFTLTGTDPEYQVEVEVTPSGRFELVAPAATTIDLGDVRRDRVTTPVALGAVTVFDDRDVLAGWNLNINSTAFTGPNSSSIAATALGYAPTGTALPAGITAGAAKLAGEGAFGVLAEGAVNSATGEFDGAVINTNLTFKAPVNAAKGTHTATLTLDLVSK
jgi:hypothetical protein